jgi:hypothetical protein
VEIDQQKASPGRYVGLVMVEKKLRGNLSTASQDDQQALIALHVTMLHEQHDVCHQPPVESHWSGQMRGFDPQETVSLAHLCIQITCLFLHGACLHQWTISDSTSNASFISKRSVSDTLLTLTPKDKANWYPCIRRSSHSSALPACSVMFLPRTSPWARSLPYPPPIL